ncbi:unnamed protein product [Debaryomyces fabryi]|nr:unnamed protein product [Debaryomyces fabryi]
MEGLRIHKSDSMKEILKHQSEKNSKDHQPFSASMDRLKVTDEYIKKLENEKKELQEKLSRQEKVIGILQGQLTANGIPILSGTISSILSGEISEAPSTASKESNEEDIPQRSVKRQLTPQRGLANKTSSSSLTSNRSLHIPKSPTGHLSPTSPTDKARDYESNRSSVYSDIDDGLSYKKSLAQLEDTKSRNKDNANETNETNHNDTINENPNSKQIEEADRTFGPGDESSINTVLENTKVKPATDGALDNKLSINDSLSTKKEISTTNLLTNNEMKDIGLVTQHKNTSTSSFNSNYKSRIKLPPSLQPPQKPGKDLSIDTSIASSAGQKLLNSSDRNDTIGRQISNDQISIQSLITTPSIMDAPPSQSTPKLGSDTGSFRKLPLTPEMGGFSGRFAQRSNDQLTGESQTNFQQPLPDHESTLLRTPITNEFLAHDSESLSRLSTQTPNSSFQVLHTPKAEEDDSALFIKPDEFQTISLTVVSTINTSNTSSSKKDDPACTISVNDRESKKEMWRIRKTYSQLVAFDNEIRPIVDYFGLPPIPDKSLFLSTSPNKVDARKNTLQNYFNTIFLMPHIPHIILYRICKYLSLDFINPLDDFRSGARKEGYLIRRYKGLGSSWKIRWCQVDGPFLEIYEIPGGVCLEQIKLRGSQIGKQTNDSVAEERGYRHAFLIMEPQKKISSSSKYFFCAESDEERDDWVEALVEFNEIGDTSMTSYGSNDNDNSFSTDLDGRAKENQEDEIVKQYSSQTSNSQTDFVGGYQYQHSTSSIDLPNNNNSEKATQKELKEAKRLKKRSIFPFRNKLNSLIFDTNAPESDLSQTVIGSQPQQEQQESNIQLYLDLMNLDDDLTKAIFGRELSVAYELSNHKLFDRSIPSICYRCLDFLLKAGAIYEEGIFRLSGSASSIRQLKDQFNTNFDIDLYESPLQPDMHTVSGLLKTYLRELPTPILGGQQYNDLKHITDTRGEASSRSELALIFRDYLSDSTNIDDIHYNVCYVIFKFLNQIIANKGTNRMNLRNVCIVFVPTLNISVEVLTTLLVDFDCIFEGGSPIANEKREVLDLYIPNF